MRRQDLERANDIAQDLAAVERELAKIEILRNSAPTYLCSGFLKLNVTHRLELFLDILEAELSREKATLEHALARI